MKSSALEKDYTQELSGDPNPQYFLKSTAVQMGGVLPYKWEAYCSTNGRCTVGFPFLQGLKARKAQRYKWGACCRTNWRCTAALFPRPVGVGVSETLLIHTFESQCFLLTKTPRHLNNICPVLEICRRKVRDFGSLRKTAPLTLVFFVPT